MLNEQPNKLRAEPKAHRHAHERQRNGYHSRGKRGLFHALMIAGGKVIPNQRQHALRHAARHAVRKHIHLLGNAKAGLHCRAVCGHKVIEHGEGYVFAQRHKAGWQANAQNLARYVLIERILIQREAERCIMPVFKHNGNEIQGRYNIGKHGCSSRTQRFIPLFKQNEHKKRIQRNVCNAAYGYTYAGLHTAPLRAQQMRHKRAERRCKPANGHGGYKIRLGVGMHGRVCAAEQVYNSVRKKHAHERIYRRYAHAAPEGEACRLLGAVPLPCPGGTGYGAGPARAEKIGYGAQYHKRRHAYGYGGYHGIAPRKADKERVRHVIYNKYYLAYHRRHGKLHYGPANGFVLKQCF